MTRARSVSLASDLPRDLALAESVDTAARVLSAELGLLAGQLGGVPHGRLEEPARSAWAEFRRALVRVARTNRGAFLSMLRGPSISAPLRVWLANVDEGEHSALAMQIATNALADLAFARALGAPIELPALVTRVAVRDRGVVDVPAGTRSIAFDDGSVRFDGRPAELVDDRAYLSEHIVFSTFDDNPLAGMEAHPEKSGNTPSLGGATRAEWCGALTNALAIIERYLPFTREEMELTLQRIVPVGVDAERHLSASYREAIGTIYLSLHPDPMTMAEALVHEHQHTKLNAALAQDEILIDALDPRFASPVRPDLRPLLGVLLAVHAFVPVAELWLRMIDRGDARASTPRGGARARDIVRGNGEGLAVLLANAKPTAVGDALLAELERHQTRHAMGGV